MAEYCSDHFEIIEDTEDSFRMWQGLVGPTYTPILSNDGTLSFSNNGGLPNPAPVNVRGPQGAGIRIAGIVETTENLPASAASGDIWLVGSESPYEGYSQINGDWIDLGPLTVGPAGPPGPQGDSYVLQESDKQEIADIAEQVLLTNLEETPLAIQYGGTGARDLAGAKENLGIDEIETKLGPWPLGTDAQDVSGAVNEMIGTISLQVEDIQKLKDDLADEFSPTQTYSLGDYCMYSGQLYVCTTAVTTAGDWTGSANWTAVTAAEELEGIKADLASLDAGDVEYSSSATYAAGTVGKGLNDVKTSLTQGTLINGMPDTGMGIPVNSDLNNYTTPGTYYVLSDGDAATISHMPRNASGTLYVINRSVGVYKTQIYYPTTSIQIHYTRNYNNGTWTDWIIVSDMNYINVSSGNFNNYTADSNHVVWYEGSDISAFSNIPSNYSSRSWPFVLEVINLNGYTKQKLYVYGSQSTVSSPTEYVRQEYFAGSGSAWSAWQAMLPDEYSYESLNIGQDSGTAMLIKYGRMRQITLDDAKAPSSGSFVFPEMSVGNRPATFTYGVFHSSVSNIFYYWLRANGTWGYVTQSAGTLVSGTITWIAVQ